MQTKHFYNDPTHLVVASLRGSTLANPALALDAENKIVYRRPTASDLKSPKVSIVSGGGSGHEPAFAGYVGQGLLTASVAGTIFASPSAEQIRRCVREHVETEKGVFMIMLNYTGDVLNFGMAAEKAKAAGIKTEFFAINDDVGVGRTKGGKVGRRGIAGGILVLKAVGALADAGGSLEEVARLARFATENTVSVASSLEHVHIPGHPLPEKAESMAHDEVEIGMGIHNEPGSHRTKADAQTLIKTMLNQLLDQNDKDRAFLGKWSPKDKFALLINNLGSVSTLELGALTAETCQQLKDTWKIEPVRIYQGTFLTSLNGMGFSISLLRLADTGLGEGRQLLDLLDAPSEATGWSAPIHKDTWNRNDWKEVEKRGEAIESAKPSNLRVNKDVLRHVLGGGLRKAIACEPKITEYDTIVGDGDCGTGLKRGAEAILKYIESDQISDDIVVTLNGICQVIENTMDGTSGAVYAIFMNALTAALRSQDPATPSGTTIQSNWAPALSSALEQLNRYTPARPGDRTLVDALAPFIDVLISTSNIHQAAKEAMDKAMATKDLKPGLGRSVYVGGEADWIGKIPDPGAVGLAEFLLGISEAVKGN
ncbi:dihydroxyacetone kinase [Ascosphaera apis ARSEF 7405]|uniref:Dihydroxyacetone kinase n=1 Tax=Ascosphaera apis ARSEF 7405 TaxID=392613 RepID=A0A166P5W9_9EURO|nr:dihydroxyacetone kinase [Ascosphaera apis ARSEF 7405]